VRIINFAVIILGKMLKIDHSLDKPFKVIAVCKYKGMGSIIQSAPLLKTLRKNYPQSRIIYISSKENIKILEQIPEVDEVIFIDDSTLLKLFTSFFPFVMRLQSRRIGIFIDLEVYSNFSTMITIFSMAKNRMGFYLNSMHYRLGNYTHMMYYNTRNSISEIYLQFARLLNCDPICTDLFSLDSRITEINISKELSLDLLKERYIVINPNASDLRIERRWGDSNFVKLTSLISKNHPSYKIVLIGSPGEAVYVEQIVKRIENKQNVFSLAGKTDIPGLIAVIKNAFLFITNDSGPMHIAFSTQTTTIALFGPCSPMQYKINSNCYVIYENLYCSPCVHEFISPPCRGDNYCMKSISVESVFEKATSILNGNEINERPEDKGMVFKIDDFTIGTLSRNN
jgi:ADP-heptose:LPS heptosyltransferase